MPKNKSNLLIVDDKAVKLRIIIWEQKKHGQIDRASYTYLLNMIFTLLDLHSELYFGRRQAFSGITYHVFQFTFHGSCRFQ